MGYRRGILGAALALTLAACGQSGTPGPAAAGGTSTAAAPEILGVVRVDFQHIGQADFSVNATVVPSGIESQTLARTGSVTFTQGARGSFTGPDHVRYLFGQLNVNNTGAARSNLTLLGINAHVRGGFQTLGDTSLARAARADGTALTDQEARQVLPLNRRTLLDDNTLRVLDSQADFQAYREGDITPAIANYMAASPYNGYAFPFGFMARSKTNTRLVPTGSGAGTVTLAFRYPDENPASTSDDLTSFTWYGLITADNENRVSTDAFEADTARACTAAQSLYGAAPVTLATLLNVRPTDCGRPASTTPQDLSTVRTSGPAGAPTTRIPVTMRSTAVAWGRNDAGQTDVPALPAGLSYTAVAAGGYHSLAVRSDGQVVAWGDNHNGQTDVPALPAGLSYTAVAGGGVHGLALRSDGQVVAWGNDAYGQTDVPALPVGLTYTAVAGGALHSLALRSDGQVVAWGYGGFFQTVVPPLPTGLSYTAVAGGGAHSLALRSDGQVVAWGYDGNGQTDVPALPAGQHYTAVAAGGYHSLALRSDGQVVAWGNDLYTNVPVLPAGLTYTAVAGGAEHSLALRSDGQVVAWGTNNSGQTDVPALPAGQHYTAVAAGGYHSLAIVQ